VIPGYNFDVLAKRLVAFSGGGGKPAAAGCQSPHECDKQFNGAFAV